jgi:hypothetical protein
LKTTGLYEEEKDSMPTSTKYTTSVGEQSSYGRRNPDRKITVGATYGQK